MGTTGIDEKAVAEAVNRLVDEYRVQCLWFLRRDYSARQIVSLLPPDEAGTCVLAASGGLFRGSPAELRQALGGERIVFHPGRVRGAFPQLKA